MQMSYSGSLQALNEHFDGRSDLIGAEIGVFRGGHAAALLERLPQLYLYMVDSYRESNMMKVNGEDVPRTMEGALAETLRVTSPFENRRLIIVAPSVRAASFIHFEHLDFCYIDAGHDYESVSTDIQVWRHRVRPGGLFYGHDYSERRYLKGVRQAVDELAAEWQQEIKIYRGKVWALTVPKIESTK